MLGHQDRDEEQFIQCCHRIPFSKIAMNAKAAAEPYELRHFHKPQACHGMIRTIPRQRRQHEDNEEGGRISSRRALREKKRQDDISDEHIKKTTVLSDEANSMKARSGPLFIENHSFMDHRQFKVGRRVIDRDSRVLGKSKDEERTRQPGRLQHRNRKKVVFWATLIAFASEELPRRPQ